MYKGDWRLQMWRERWDYGEEESTSMSDSKELRTLRAMAIERAIGEVNAALGTFWEDTEINKKQYYNLKDVLEMLKECR